MPKENNIWYQDAGLDLIRQLKVNLSGIWASIRMYLKNLFSNRLHHLYSAAISKALSESSPAMEAHESPTALRSPTLIRSSVASKASTLGSMGVTHHLKSMSVKPRSIGKSLDDTADDAVHHQLAQDIQADEGGSQTPDGANGADDDADEEPWTDGEWNEWVAMGCPDYNGITLPAGPTSAALERPPL